MRAYPGAIDYLCWSMTSFLRVSLKTGSGLGHGDEASAL